MILFKKVNLWQSILFLKTVSLSAESLLKKKIIFHIILTLTSDSSLCKGGSSLYDRFKQNHLVLQYNETIK